ncbi:DEAD/DEAH box helicase [Anopheles sinensis]|uniref:DEAD/DEAH box helicase n=1 Tax=Anopheles sinensis TaxID=74873 RepID=A0A084VSW6_ANOSI|nr:DEAD/DEAH box helicase [Anopheles sinensis]
MEGFQQDTARIKRAPGICIRSASFGKGIRKGKGSRRKDPREFRSRNVSKSSTIVKTGPVHSFGVRLEVEKLD